MKPSFPAAGFFVMGMLLFLLAHLPAEPAEARASTPPGTDAAGTAESATVRPGPAARIALHSLPALEIPSSDYYLVECIRTPSTAFRLKDPEGRIAGESRPTLPGIQAFSGYLEKGVYTLETEAVAKPPAEPDHSPDAALQRSREGESGALIKITRARGADGTLSPPAPLEFGSPRERSLKAGERLMWRIVVPREGIRLLVWCCGDGPDEMRLLDEDGVTVKPAARASFAPSSGGNRRALVHIYDPRPGAYTLACFGDWLDASSEDGLKHPPSDARVTSGCSACIPDTSVRTALRFDARGFAVYALKGEGTLTVDAGGCDVEMRVKDAGGWPRTLSSDLARGRRTMSTRLGGDSIVVLTGKPGAECMLTWLRCGATAGTQAMTAAAGPGGKVLLTSVHTAPARERLDACGVVSARKNWRSRKNVAACGVELYTSSYLERTFQFSHKASLFLHVQERGRYSFDIIPRTASITVLPLRDVEGRRMRGSKRTGKLALHLEEGWYELVLDNPPESLARIVMRGAEAQGRPAKAARPLVVLPDVGVRGNPGLRARLNRAGSGESGWALFRCPLRGNVSVWLCEDAGDTMLPLAFRHPVRVRISSPGGWATAPGRKALTMWTDAGVLSDGDVIPAGRTRLHIQSDSPRGREFTLSFEPAGTAQGTHSSSWRSTPMELHSTGVARVKGEGMLRFVPASDGEYLFTARGGEAELGVCGADGTTSGCNHSSTDGLRCILEWIPAGVLRRISLKAPARDARRWIEVRRAVVADMGLLRPGLAARSELPTCDVFEYRLEVPRDDWYELDVTQNGTDARWRVLDPRGGRILARGIGHGSLFLQAGTYPLHAVSIGAGYADLSFERRKPGWIVSTSAGEGIPRLPLGVRVYSTLAPRTTGRWELVPAAPCEVKISVSPWMQWRVDGGEEDSTGARRWLQAERTVHLAAGRHVLEVRYKYKQRAVAYRVEAVPRCLLPGGRKILELPATAKLRTGRRGWYRVRLSPAPRSARLLLEGTSKVVSVVPRAPYSTCLETVVELEPGSYVLEARGEGGSSPEVSFEEVGVLERRLSSTSGRMEMERSLLERGDGVRLSLVPSPHEDIVVFHGEGFPPSLMLVRRAGGATESTLVEGTFDAATARAPSREYEVFFFPLGQPAGAEISLEWNGGEIQRIPPCRDGRTLNVPLHGRSILIGDIPCILYELVPQEGAMLAAGGPGASLCLPLGSAGRRVLMRAPVILCTPGGRGEPSGTAAVKVRAWRPEENIPARLRIPPGRVVRVALEGKGFAFLALEANGRLDISASQGAVLPLPGRSTSLCCVRLPATVGLSNPSSSPTPVRIRKWNVHALRPQEAGSGLTEHIALRPGERGRIALPPGTRNVRIVCDAGVSGAALDNDTPVMLFGGFEDVPSSWRLEGKCGSLLLINTSNGKRRAAIMPRPSPPPQPDGKSEEWRETILPAGWRLLLAPGEGTAPACASPLDDRKVHGAYLVRVPSSGTPVAHAAGGELMVLPAASLSPAASSAEGDCESILLSPGKVRRIALEVAAPRGWSRRMRVECAGGGDSRPFVLSMVPERTIVLAYRLPSPYERRWHMERIPGGIVSSIPLPPGGITLMTHPAAPPPAGGGDGFPLSMAFEAVPMQPARGAEGLLGPGERIWLELDPIPHEIGIGLRGDPDLLDLAVFRPGSEALEAGVSCVVRPWDDDTPAFIEVRNPTPRSARFALEIAGLKRPPAFMPPREEER